MTEEIWRAVTPPEFAAYYEVSSLGRIRRSHDKITIGSRSNSGYHTVALHVGGKRVDFRVNILVCLAFHGMPPSLEHDCLHRDNDKSNNTPNNLYWGTSKDNAADRKTAGYSWEGTRNPNAKLDWDKVREIRRRVAAGEKPYRIQGEYGLSSGGITKIVKNQTWVEPIEKILAGEIQ
jgi:hypothetical protein